MGAGGLSRRTLRGKQQETVLQFYGFRLTAIILAIIVPALVASTLLALAARPFGS
jgi:hypothetical protein